VKPENVEVRLTEEQLEDLRDLDIETMRATICNPEPTPGQELSYGGTDPIVSAAALVNRMQAGISMPFHSPKWWGYELTYINDPGLYTMKLLSFSKGGHTSMHYHIDKHETLLVAKGVLTLETLFNKERHVYRLGEGAAWVVPPGYAHRLIAAHGPVILVEASTHDSADDSIRIS
jgi:quercetin dioxygenase-like cupin family protein